MAIVQYHVTFQEQRLGMCLADSPDGAGVEVVAFTEADGQLGPAELSGKVQVGDKGARPQKLSNLIGLLWRCSLTCAACSGSLACRQ